MQDTSSIALIDNAGLYRAGRWLVRNVSFSLCSGEIVTLIGPNGAGKSTTAKMMLGVFAPDEGSAWQRPRLRLAYVPQKLTIDWMLPLTVRRFMDLTGRITDAEATAALAETDVAHLSRSQMQTLSGGEFQRVLLARAIARKPELLVLDEPVQGVDFAGEAALYDLIRQIRDRLGCAILLISHNLHLVMAATDRVICLNGRVCCSGTPTVVSASTEYRELFGSRAASALAVYEHDHHRAGTHDAPEPDARSSAPREETAAKPHLADETHG